MGGIGSGKKGHTTAEKILAKKDANRMAMSVSHQVKPKKDWRKEVSDPKGIIKNEEKMKALFKKRYNL